MNQTDMHQRDTDNNQTDKHNKTDLTDHQKEISSSPHVQQPEAHPPHQPQENPETQETREVPETPETQETKDAKENQDVHTAPTVTTDSNEYANDKPHIFKQQPFRTWVILSSVGIGILIIIAYTYWRFGSHPSSLSVDAGENTVLQYHQYNTDNDSSDAENEILSSLTKRIEKVETEVLALQRILSEQENHSRANHTVPAETLAAQLADALHKLQTFDKRLTAFEHHQQKVARIFATVEELKNLMREGKPFANTLDRFADLMENYPAFQQPIQELAEFATLGIPTLQHLQEKIIVLIGTEASSSEMTEENKKAPSRLAAWWGHVVTTIKNTVKNMVHIYKINDTTKNTHPLSLKEALKIAQECLQKGHIEEAITALQSFEHVLSSEEQSFLNHLQARRFADKTLEHIENLLYSPRYIQLLIIPQ
jgi:hypothetical protein